MNNIKTTADVLEWAKTIVEAKGEKYIPLAKSDMLAIAQYIVDAGNCKRDTASYKDDDEPVKTEQEKPITAVGTADPKPAVEEVRIEASGLGGIGICHAELFANGRLLVPRAVLDVRGNVDSPECLLRNNTNFAWFGGHSTRYDYFTRCAAEQQHSVTLEMKAFSPDNIAMAR